MLSFLETKTQIQHHILPCIEMKAILCLGTSMRKGAVEQKTKKKKRIRELHGRCSAGKGEEEETWGGEGGRRWTGLIRRK